MLRRRLNMARVRKNVGGGGGGFGLGVSAKGNGSGASATTNAVTTQASGSTFVVDVVFDAGTTVSSITDSKSNTYSQQGTTQTNSSLIMKSARYICVNGTGGSSHTWTVTCSGAGAVPSVFGTEIKGGLTSGIVDVHVQGNDENSPFSVASGTLAQANEYALSFFASYPSEPPTASHAVTGDGFVMIQETTDCGTSWVGAVGGVKVSATTSVTPQWTETKTTAATSVFVTSFKGP